MVYSTRKSNAMPVWCFSNVYSDRALDLWVGYCIHHWWLIKAHARVVFRTKNHILSRQNRILNRLAEKGVMNRDIGEHKKQENRGRRRRGCFE